MGAQKLVNLINFSTNPRLQTAPVLFKWL